MVNTTKFFFYGIFIDAEIRKGYGLPEYAKYSTISDYATYGNNIVKAAYTPSLGLSLTGVLVDVPDEQIEMLDQAERGYDRIEIETHNAKAQMYVAPIKD